MRRKGFTLIEIILALAIGGLVFVIVFLTLPSVWRNQRDASRRDDMLAFVQKLKNFQTNNNRGALPTGSNEVITREIAKSTASDEKTSWAAFYRDFFDDSFMDPLGESYKLVITECNPGSNGASTWDADCVGTAIEANTKQFPNDYKIYVVVGAKCSGEEKKPIAGSANRRKVALLYRLEGGGIYCGES